MELMIEISEEDYEKIKNTSFVENTELTFHQSLEDRKGTMMLFRVMDSISDGTPLPKGHGDLKDADRLLDSFYEYCKNGDFGYHQAEDLIKSSLTLIEADNGGREDEEA